MKKQILNSFISKYNLNGTVESAKWKIEKHTISTNLVTPDKTLIGNVTYNDFDLEDSEMGIFDTGKLQKLITVFDGDVDMDVFKIDNESKILNLTSGKSKVKFILSNLSVIPMGPKKMQIPKFEYKIDITSDFVNKFTKGKNALPDISHVTFNTNKQGMEIIFGYSKNNTSQVSVQLDEDSSSDIDHQSFNSSYLKEILSNNELDVNCSSATIEISKQGLMRVSYKNKNYNSEYYLVEVSHV